MKTIFWHTFETPWGKCFIAQGDQGIVAMTLPQISRIDVKKELARLKADMYVERKTELLSKAQKELTQFLLGKRNSFNLPLDLSGTDFQIKVWKTLQKIPYGETWSYKKVAETIGKPRAVRAVGGANNKNPIPIVIPCHRVVGKNGDLVGYGGGLPMKRRLLDLELGLAKASPI